jgi:hypothetical protein
MTHYPIVMQQGNNIYSFFLNIHTYRQTDTHSLLFIREDDLQKKEEEKKKKKERRRKK